MSFEEINAEYQKRKKEKEQNLQSSENSQSINNINSRQVAENFLSIRVRDLFNNNNQFQTNYNKRYFDSNGKFNSSVYRSDTDNWLSATQKHYQYFNTQADEINKLLDHNSGILDTKYVSNIKKLLDDGKKQNEEMLKVASADKDYYTQFDNEAHWRSAYNNERFSQKYNGYSYAEAKKALENASDKEEAQWLSNNLNEFMTSEDAAKKIAEIDSQIKSLGPDFSHSSTFEEYADEAVDYLYDRNNLKKEKQKYEGIRSRKAEEEKISELSSVKSNSDFKKLSAYDPKNSNSDYDYINGLIKDTRIASNDAVMTAMLKSYENNGYDAMTEEEKRVYNYYYNSGNKEKAAEYLSSIRNTLLKRKSDSLSSDIQKTVNEAGFIGNTVLSLATVPMNVFGSIPAFLGDVAGMATGTYSPYASTRNIQRAASDIRGSVADKIADNTNITIGGQNVLSQAYQGVMSTADSLLGATTLGKLYTVSMSMGAASQKAQELYERGASDKQIVTGGILSGIAEGLFEKVSLDHLLKAKEATTLSKLIYNFFIAQGFVEGSEEVATDIANFFIDEGVMGSNSERANKVKKYTARGLSEKEAEKRAILDKITEAAWSGAVGAFSGMLSGGAFSAAETADTIKSGSIVKNENNTEALKAAALETDRSSEAYKLASEMNKTKSEPSSFKTGALYKSTVSQQIKEANAGKSQIEIENELIKSGLSETEAAVFSDTISKLISGKKVSQSRYNSLISNEKASGVLLRTAEDNADKQRQGQNKAYQTQQLAVSSKNKLISKINSLRESNINISGEEITKGLKQNGVSGYTAKKISPALEKYLNGKNLTREETKLIANNAAVMKTANQIVNNKLKSAQNEAVSQKENNITDETKTEIPDDFDKNISSEGKTIITKTGKQITIESINSLDKHGNMTFRTSEGEEVNMKDVSYASDGEALVISAIASTSATPQAATMMYKAFEPGKHPLNRAKFYARGIQWPFNDGLSRRAMRSPGAYDISEKQAKIAYNAGREAAQNRDAERRAKTINKRAALTENGEIKGNNQIFFEEGINQNTLSSKQKTGVETAKLLVNAGLSNDVHFFSSYTNSDGKRVFMYRGKELSAPNGWYQPSDGSIWIDLNSGDDGQGLVLFTLSHELTHNIRAVSPDSFNRLADFLREEYGDNKFENLIEKELMRVRENDEYSKLSESELYDIAYEEVVCQSMETMLTDTNAVEKFVKLRYKEPTVFERIKNWISNFIEKIKAAYKGIKPDSEAGRVFQKTIKDFEKIEELFAEALNNAIESGMGENNHSDDKNMSFSIRSGAKDDIEKVLKDKYYQAEIKLTETTPLIITSQKGAKNLPMLMKSSHIRENIFTEEEAKKAGLKTGKGINYHGLGKELFIKVIDGLEDVEYAYRGTKNANDPTRRENYFLLISQYNDKYGNIINVPVFINETGRFNRVFIGTNKIATVFGRSDFYKYIQNEIQKGNLVKIKNRSNSSSELTAPIAADYVKNASKNIIRTNEPKSQEKEQENFSKNFSDTKVHFSLRNTVEETKDLIAVHNIKESKLLQSFQLGGLPSPSIAIAKASIGHNNFGEISLVFDKASIDPANQENYVYSSDAYTPTFPHISYKVNEQFETRLRDKYYELSNKIGYDETRPLYKYISEMEDELTRNNGEEGVIENVKNDTGIMQIFLQDSGKDKVEPVYKEEKKEISEAIKEQYDFLITALGDDFFDGLKTPPGEKIFGHRRKYITENLDKIKKAYSDFLKTTYGFSDEEAENVLANESVKTISDMITNIYLYRRSSSAVKQVYDSEATKKAIENAVNKKEYYDWVDNLFKGIAEKKGIRNQTDTFDSKGNRRSFELLNYEYTLENIVRAMKESDSKGMSLLGGNIFGAATTEYSSIEDIKADEDRLYEISDEEKDAKNKEFNERFSEIVYSLVKEPTNFMSQNGGAELLIEAIIKFRTKSGIANYIKREGDGWTEYSDHIVDDLMELVSDIRKMPTRYFEAKPQRPVYFNEVKAAVVPDNVSDEVRNGLSELGISVVEYERDNNEARTRALNSLENLKFSRRNNSKEKKNSVDRAATTRYNSSIKWVYDRKLFTVVESKLFHQKISEINQGSQAFVKNADGEYMLPIENKIVFTDGNYDSPQISKIIEVITDYYSTFEEIKECIFDVERGLRTGNGISMQAFTNAFEEMLILQYSNQTDRIYEWETGKYKGTNRRKVIDNYRDEQERRRNAEKSENGALTNDNEADSEEAAFSMPENKQSDRNTLPKSTKLNDALEEREKKRLSDDVTRLHSLNILVEKAFKGEKIKQSTLINVASLIMKEAGVTRGKTKTAEILRTVYETLVGNRKISADEVERLCREAAEKILDLRPAQSSRSEEVKEALSSIRKQRISLSDTQLQEAKNSFGDEFRKIFLGKVTISSDGTSLEKAWQSWAEEFPGVFDKNTHEAQMLERINDLYSQNFSENKAETEYQRDELALSIYDHYWKLTTLQTYANNVQKEVNALTRKHREEIQKLREGQNDRIRKVNEQKRKERSEIILKERERAQKAIQKNNNEYNEKRKEAAEKHARSQTRQMLVRQIESMESALKRTKKNNVKEELRDVVQQAVKSAKVLFRNEVTDSDIIKATGEDGIATASDKENEYIKQYKQLLKSRDFYIKNIDELTERQPAGYLERIEEYYSKIDSIDSQLSYRMKKLSSVIEGERRRINSAEVNEALGELSDAYGKLKDSDKPYLSRAFNQGVYDRLNALRSILSGTKIIDMTSAQLREVYDSYTAVLTTIKKSNELFADGKQSDIDETENTVRNEITSKNRSDRNRMAVTRFLRDFAWADLKPIYAMRMIGSDTLTKLYRNVRSGEDKWIKTMQKARDFELETKKKFHFKDWDRTKNFTVTARNGNKCELSLEQVMSLYAYSMREQAQEHLNVGGFRFKDGIKEVKEKGITVKYEVNNSMTYNLGAEEMFKIANLLTEEQREYVKAMQNYLSTTMADLGNDVSLQLYGIKLFREKNYFPIKTAEEFRHFNAEKTQDGEIQLVNNGMTKETVPDAKNPIILDDFSNIWAGHVDTMAKYNALVLPLEDFKRVYGSYSNEEGNSQSVRGAIRNAFGDAPVKYIQQLLRDMNGGSINQNGMNDISGKMTSLMKRGAVFASMSVTVQQPSAIARAMAYISPKYFIPDKSYEFKKHSEKWNELKQYAPIAAIKEMGYFDTGMGKSSVDWLNADEYEGIKEKAFAFIKDGNYRDEALSWTASMADEITWVAIWNASKREASAKGFTGKEMLEKAGKKFTEVIELTQVYDSVFSRSQLMRSKDGLNKMMTAFMAEPTTQINMLADAVIQGKRKGGEEGIKFGGKVGAALVANVFFNSILKALVTMGRDDDEEKKLAEKYLGKFSSDFIESLNPLQNIPYVKDIISLCQGYDVERTDLSVVTEVINAVRYVGSDNKTTFEKAEKLVGALGNLCGIPAKNIWRDFKGAYNIVLTVKNNGVIMSKEEILPTVTEAISGESSAANQKSKIFKALLSGKKERIDKLKKEYEDEDEFFSVVKSVVSERYKNGIVKPEQAKYFLINYGGLSREEAEDRISYLDFKKKYKYDLSQSQVTNYYDVCETVGISLDVYADYIDKVRKCEGEDKDGDGKTDSGSKKAAVLNVINSLPLNSAQKDALYLLNYSKNELSKAPWH